MDGHNDANLDLFKTTDGGVTWTRVYDYDIYESPSSQNEDLVLLLAYGCQKI